MIFRRVFHGNVFLQFEFVAEVFEKVEHFFTGTRFLGEQFGHLGLELAHFRVEIHSFVSVDKLDVFARHKRPAFGLDFFERGGVAVFGNVFVCLFVPFALPVVEIFGDLSNLLRRETDVFFLKRFTPLAQILKSTSFSRER